MVTRGRESRAICLEAKKRQRLQPPDAKKKQGRIFPQSLGRKPGSVAALTLAFSPSELRKQTCCLKPLNWWPFFMAALGN